MTRSTLRLTVASLLLSPALALAAVPGTISFSARIADNGRPVTGTQGFVFRLWNDPTASDTAANLVWQEPATGTKDVVVTDGVATAALGDTVALPAFTGAPLYLEVSMGATTFSPRVPIQAVPYAFRAGTVDAVAAKSSGDGGAVSVTSTTAYTEVSTLAVTFPGAGFAHVQFEAEPYLCGPINNNFRVTFDGTTVRAGWFETHGTASGTTYPHPMSRTFVLPVTAGAHTIAAAVQPGAACTIWHPEISVVFTPNSL